MRISDWSSDVCSSDLQPRSLTAFWVSGVSSPGAHPMKTLAAQATTLPDLQTLLGYDAQGLTKGVFDLLPVGIYVCDSEGRVVDYNRAAAELWGQSPERGSPAVRFCGSYRLYALDGDRKSTRLNSSH